MQMPQSMTPQDAASVEDIKALLNTYETALNTADADLAASLYTEDGVFMPHFTPTASGSAIGEMYNQIFKAIRLSITFHIDDISVEGSTAHALTRSEGDQTILATHSTGPEANRELFVFQKQNGMWKIARYMFNKTAPAAI